MKYTIKGQEKEPKIEFSLEIEIGGNLHLKANGKTILTISTEGTLFRYHSVDIEGIKTNESGQISEL